MPSLQSFARACELNLSNYHSNTSLPISMYDGIFSVTFTECAAVYKLQYI